MGCTRRIDSLYILFCLGGQVRFDWDEIKHRSN